MKKTTPEEGTRPSLLEPGQTFGVIGTGIMGCTILKGLLNAGAFTPDQAWGVARSRSTCEEASRELGVSVAREAGDRVATAGVIVLSVKPTQAVQALSTLRDSGLRPDTLLVSILAGTTLQQLESLLGTANPWVRAMPNTPCAIACGMTVLALGSRAGAPHLALARRIFEPLGRVLELEEKHMDTVTGLSASGPAFVYVMIEALADGGVARGLPRLVAIEMAAQMVYGAASMVLRSGRHPAALKDDVTTPAGCTIAGILALEDGRIRSVLSRAVEVASLRAGELGGGR